MKELRLDKYLADCGIGTRSEIRTLIKNSRVTINGEAVTAAVKLVPGSSSVYVDGVPVTYQKYYYLMMNKPDGVISATDGENASRRLEPTVAGLLEGRYKNLDLFPVGRLDKDTTGLLILTNDGQFAHNTLSPKKHVDKVYRAAVRGTVTDETVTRFAAGIELRDGYVCGAAELRFVLPPEYGVSEIEITIREGKYHQVKRMFEAVGMQVLTLKRVAFGGLRLDEALVPGGYRPLTDCELRLFGLDSNP